MPSPQSNFGPGSEVSENALSGELENSLLYVRLAAKDAKAKS